jgi:hypothetical protein
MSIVPLAIFNRSSPTRRLWLGGSAIGVFLLTLVVGNAVIARDRAVTSDMVGHDFLAFYTAGSFVLQGRTHELYRLESVRQFEQSTGHAAGLTIGDSFGPWWNPPFYALVFEPLAKLPYRSALAVWRWAGLAAVGGAVVLLMRMLPGGRASRGLVPLLVVSSMPFVQSFSHGQNTFTSLLILTAAVTFWRAESAVLAGMAAGLLFYKPQLGTVVAAVMILDLGPRAIVGLGITGVTLLVVTLVAMPGSLGDWLHGLPANVRWMQIDHDYLWERHVTIKAFWRLLFQGRAAGEPFFTTTVLTDACMAAVVGGGLLAVWRSGSTALQRRTSGRPESLQVRIKKYLAPRRRGAEEMPDVSIPRSPSASLRLCARPFFGCLVDERGRQRRSNARRLNRDRLISATIVAMPLLMPFYFDYDLLLLAVPATLYAIDPRRDRRVTAAWVVLYVWLFVNPAVGLHTHVDGTVIVLSFIAALMLGRVGKEVASVLEAAIDPVVEPTRIAA